MAEYFAAKGRDVLVVFDDLTKHAWAYRQLSLLLDRPPGREAYPGDVFYVQTQLMERAGRFNEAHGGGSITFLGIAETLQGDLTGYIPSNLASMCDGQVVLSSSIFAEGFRPAIDPMLSLSIIGGRVQPPILRSLARTLRADFARYMEIQALSRLQTGLSGEAEATVRKGQYTPSNLAEVVLLLYALDRGMVQPLTPDQRDRLRSEVYGFTLQQDGDLVRRIERKRELTPDIDRDLGKTLKLFLDRLK
jgi:F-type H+-transporting ATPase subunit alpha